MEKEEVEIGVLEAKFWPMRQIMITNVCEFVWSILKDKEKLPKDPWQ